MKQTDLPLIALMGNPNVGKSTVFNSLSGLKQHTGNWSGKTVSFMEGEFIWKTKKFKIIDLPGIYSLNYFSKDEEIARDFIVDNPVSLIVLIINASCLERNLNLFYQIKNIHPHLIVGLNMMDELTQNGLTINIELLTNKLGVPVIPLTATIDKGIDDLKDAIFEDHKKQKKIISIESKQNAFFPDCQENYEKASQIYKDCVKKNENTNNSWKKKLDKIFISPSTIYPLMLISFLFVLWITIKGANYPSTILYQFFFFLEKKIKFLFLFLNSPEWLTGLLIDGIYRNLAWVVSVMLPPMAIFFPCFTFLEDLGFLPRIAFHLDTLFKKVGGHGKQALTMCMGFGCNAAGVISTRIIGSQKEKLIAILTNNFVPCNGRFPTLILLSTLFISPLVEKKYSSLFTALTVMLIILIGIFFTFLVSWILSKTILKGEPSSFILELPPIRKPRILSILYRSFIERTLAVLWRAVIVSAPVGAIIWMGGNILYNNRPIILTLSNFFEFPGTLLGMNGLILLSFILAFPANEILFPIIIMVYTQSGRLTDINSTQELYDLLILNGWNLLTAVNLMLFSLLHFPCGTVLLSIYKETKSKKWTFYSAIIPTIIACIVTYLTTLIFKDFFH